MFNQYFPLLLIATFAIILGAIVVVLGAIFGPHRPTKRKGMPYESGMVPYGPGTRRMTVRYYLLAILFILFDIEVVFFMPWVVAFRDLGWSGLIIMIVFAFILEVAYVYAWKKGALEWE
jgi:NADH-quinone oxidoreductase subunit A